MYTTVSGLTLNWARMANEDLRTVLAEIVTLLESGREYQAAARIHTALSGPAEELTRVLISNDLWGGAGSVADQSLIEDPSRRNVLEDLLIRLGTLQIAD